MKIYLLCALCAFGLSVFFCSVEIPLLKRAGAGQNILHYVKEHEGKGGTPTMGGLGFILAAVCSALLLSSPSYKPLQAAIVIGLGYLCVGFLDDLLKKKHKENLGLKAYQKILFQLAVAVIASVYCYKSGFTALKIPFTKTSLEIGWGVIPLGILVFLATVNGVNLTDGLDGLAGSVSAVFFAIFSVLLLLQEESGELACLSSCLFGALAAFLLFNVNRASVFMGDTGSLALGGFISALALFTGNALVIPFLGVMFVISSISVIVQVIYYKKTGKRVFLMAPVHHHFQQKGYSEAKIAYAYCVITACVGGLLCLPFL